MARDKDKQRARQKAYRERHREELRARNSAHSVASRKRHREQVLVREKAFRVSHRDELRARATARRLAFGEHINALRKANYAARREERRRYDKAWRESHKEQRSARRKVRRVVTFEKDKAKRQAWNAAHPDRIRQTWVKHDGKRRAAERQTRIEDIDYARVIQDANGLCGICQRPFDLFGIHIDHIVPLSRGGTHTYDNLQATHAFCNMSKGAKVG